jgi:hypothetical protein
MIVPRAASSRGLRHAGLEQRHRGADPLPSLSLRKNAFTRGRALAIARRVKARAPQKQDDQSSLEVFCPALATVSEFLSLESNP